MDGDTTVYVSHSGQKWHTSERCAGHNAPMSLRMAVGYHNPCGNCVGQEARAAVEELVG